MQKWGLIRQSSAPHERFWPSPNSRYRQASAETKKAISRELRSLQAARSGQLAFDFRDRCRDCEIIKLKHRKRKKKDSCLGRRGPRKPQQTLKRGYFLKGSTLDVDEPHQARRMVSKALETIPTGDGDINLSNIH